MYRSRGDKFPATYATAATHSEFTLKAEQKVSNFEGSDAYSGLFLGTTRLYVERHKGIARLYRITRRI